MYSSVLLRNLSSKVVTGVTRDSMGSRPRLQGTIWKVWKEDVIESNTNDDKKDLQGVVNPT